MRNIFTLLSLLTLVSFSYSEKNKTIYLIRNGETDYSTDSLSRSVVESMSLSMI